MTARVPEELETWKERRAARNQALGLPDDREIMSEDYRRSAREKIAQGLLSARQGRLVDGESFFAEMDAEFAEMERRQGG